jgi:hypothetical protein
MIWKLLVAAYCAGVVIGLLVIAISIRNAPYMDE